MVKTPAKKDVETSSGSNIYICLYLLNITAPLYHQSYCDKKQIMLHLLQVISKNKIMRKFYLVSAVIVTILILIIAAAQFGATCVWYLIPTNSSPVFVLIQVAGLGAVVGGLLMSWWKMPKPGAGDGDDEGDDEGDVEGAAE